MLKYVTARWTNAVVRLALLLLSAAPFVCADDAANKSQIDTLLADAAVANLRTQDSRPFHLRLEIHVNHLSAKPLDGTYDETWQSPSAWQRQISFPDFAQQEVGDSKGRWLARNLDFRPHAIFLLSLAVETKPVSLQPGEQIKKVFERKKDGLELHCADIKRGTWERTLCFSAAGPLVSSDEDHESEGPKLRLEYMDFQKFGEKLFPRQMRVYQNGEQVLEVKVVALDPLPDATPTHFDHAANARLMAVCDRSEESHPVKKVTPQYPPEALRNHQQGTVTLYTALAADGSVVSVKLLGSAGAAFDNASIQAVRQWVYPPLTCGARPLPSEREVQVTFSIR